MLPKQWEKRTILAKLQKKQTGRANCAVAAGENGKCDRGRDTGILREGQIDL